MTENGARRIRLGMVGGGTGAFIGYVHRIASRIDGDYDLVAGALSSHAEIARESGRNIGLADDRIYTSYEEMCRAETARPDGIEVVAIVTPNHMHFAPAKLFLEAGIHVICDKPMTATLEDARRLAAVTPKNGAKFLLTHNYTGYPLIRQARALVQAGSLGPIRVVQVEYPQDWLTTAAEATGSKQAEWRTDPARSGAGGAIGDIGTHAHNLVGFVAGLKTEAVAADLTIFVPGRKLDDNVHIMLRFAGGARGMLWASQVAVGEENGLKLRVYGEHAGIEWLQAEPNKMWFTEFGKPKQMLTRGGAIDGTAASAMGIRIPGGHPEGYLEAFATLYAQFAEVIRGRGEEFEPLLPGREDGVEGLQFITASVKSSAENSRWVGLDEV